MKDKKLTPRQEAERKIYAALKGLTVGEAKLLLESVLLRLDSNVTVGDVTTFYQ